MYNDHLGIAGKMCTSVKSTTRLHIEQAEYSCILSVRRKLATLLKVFIEKNTTGSSYPDTPPTHICTSDCNSNNNARCNFKFGFKVGSPNLPVHEVSQSLGTSRFCWRVKSDLAPILYASLS